MEVSPGPGITASRERLFDYAASEIIGELADSGRQQPARHNPGGGITFARLEESYFESKERNVL
jgi:hypothetical protein